MEILIFLWEMHYWVILATALLKGAGFRLTGTIDFLENY